MSNAIDPRMMNAMLDVTGAIDERFAKLAEDNRIIARSLRATRHRVSVLTQKMNAMVTHIDPDSDSLPRFLAALTGLAMRASVVVALFAIIAAVATTAQARWNATM
jgi:hypothetical protein